MKRIRAEQLQTTTLLYLKKRNYTDSEITFRNQFKFSSSPVQAGADLITKNLISNLDVSAIMSQSLDEYFHAFKSLQEFINIAVQHNRCKGLKNILLPVFVHAYLDLVNAGRQQEAEDFFTLFHDNEYLKADIELLTKLNQIKESNNLPQYPNIEEIRQKSYEVNLNHEEKEILIRFIHGQENLIVAKILNERISFGDAKLNLIESITSDEINALNVVGKSAVQTHNGEKIVSLNETPADEDPMIISRPYMQSPVPTPNSQIQTTEKTSLKFNVDEVLVQKQIKWVKSSSSSIQGLCLYSFDDKKNLITNVSLSNNKRLICCCREDSVVTLWDICHSVNGKDELISSENCHFKPYPDISLVTFGNEYASDVYERSKKLSMQRKQELANHKVTNLQGHSGPIYSSAFSHNDEFLLTCSEDTTIRLWDLNVLKNKAMYNGHNYPVLCVNVSALSFYFASGSMDRTARLWSFDRTHPLRIFAGHEHSVETVAFHGNASYIASADHTVRLWDINSGKTVRLLVGHWAPVTCLAFSPDGRLLASSGEDGRIRLWDIGSGNLVKEIRSHSDTVYSLSFNPDNSLLASCGSDCSVSVWSTILQPSVSDTSLKKLQSHVSAQWKLNNEASRVLFNQFSGDILNCIAIS